MSRTIMGEATIEEAAEIIEGMDEDTIEEVRGDSNRIIVLSIRMK